MLPSSSVSRHLCLSCGNSEDKNFVRLDSLEIRGAKLSAVFIQCRPPTHDGDIEVSRSASYLDHFRYHHMAHLTNAECFVSQGLH